MIGRMDITHIRFLTVPVSDQDVAKRFYADILGFEVVMDESTGPVRWLQLAPKGATTNVVLAAHMPDMAPGGLQGLMLESRELDADCERLRQAGGRRRPARPPLGTAGDAHRPRRQRNRPRRRPRRRLSDDREGTRIRPRTGRRYVREPDRVRFADHRPGRAERHRRGGDDRP
jgi:hypothetical protein